MINEVFSDKQAKVNSMSNPTEADDVKLISSLFSPDKELVDNAITEMEGVCGKKDWISPWLLFDRTRYYEKEMGWPLHRRFVSFRDLIRPEELVDKKLIAMDLENKYTRNGRRQINIDPGYISLERLILATGKNYTHRIYLSKGIYADLTLTFNRGSFKSLEWTYRDYSDPVTIGFFNEQREKYKNQLRGVQKGFKP
jgi:hypothetical protein